MCAPSVLCPKARCWDGITRAQLLTTHHIRHLRVGCWHSSHWEDGCIRWRVSEEIPFKAIGKVWHSLSCTDYRNKEESMEDVALHAASCMRTATGGETNGRWCRAVRFSPGQLACRAGSGNTGAARRLGSLETADCSGSPPADSTRAVCVKPKRGGERRVDARRAAYARAPR